MVRRNFKRLDKDDFCLIYKTYIRPHLEYSVQSWSPHLQKDIQCLESVQRAATRLVPSVRKCSYKTRLRKLGLTSLESRRARGDLIEVYKILTGREKVNSLQFFKLAENPKGLRGHSLKLIKRRTHLDTRKFSFGNRIVNAWNSLPQQAVKASTVNGFKNELDRHWKSLDKKTW